MDYQNSHMPATRVDAVAGTLFFWTGACMCLGMIWGTLAVFLVRFDHTGLFALGVIAACLAVMAMIVSAGCINAALFGWMMRAVMRDDLDNRNHLLARHEKRGFTSDKPGAAADHLIHPGTTNSN